MNHNKLSLPTKERALPGREAALLLENTHFVHGRPIQPPFGEDHEQLSIIYLGLGCFWGAERKFWSLPGVFTTAVGYGAGTTPNPTYKEVCSGLTGHNELVMVVYDEQTISVTELLKVFFESHNPTQGMRQGNDVGTQYRSGIYTTSDVQRDAAVALRDAYQVGISSAGYGSITTEIAEATEFFYAEQYHQQYLAKNPSGYCGLGGTGVNCVV